MKMMLWQRGVAFVLLALPALGQSSAPVPVSDRAAARLLDQASWGPTPAAVQQVESLGVNGWLQAQFAAPASDLPDQPLLNAEGKSNNALGPVQLAFFQNTISGADQLRQRVAFALSEIFVISSLTVHPAYAQPVYWRLLRDNAFGNYRDIMKAVTLSPAMGNYLNMANNNKANARKGTAPNENYAREFQQLFTLGLVQLNPDGSPMLDANGNPVPTYNQAEVTETARVLTGWTYPTAPGATAKNNNPSYFIGPMIPGAAEGDPNHDTGAKTVVGGVQIPAGQTAAQDLDALLDALMQQNTMAPFVSAQLIQHLVTSNPSPQYVERVANVFLNDGTGTRGNMQAVITAILMDREARAGDDAGVVPNARFGHLREPVLFMANLLRGLNATLGPKSAIQNQTNQMGQNLFFPPSVFSYFSPQYRTEKGRPGPEFQLYTTATVAARADIVNSILYGTLDKSTAFDFSAFTSLADLNALVDYISYAFFYHDMSSSLQLAITNAAGAETSPQKAAQAALYVALTSGEYQIVH